MLSLGAVEFDGEVYRYIVLMHVMFFLSLIAEFNYHGHFNRYSFLILIIFLFAQFIRYWSIKTLGKNWNTRIIVLKGKPLIEKGPYKFLNHPNYLAVILEIASLPLIFSLYFTCILFSVLNSFILIRRIRIENKSLR